MQTIDYRPDHADFSLAIARCGIADLVGAATDIETLETRITEDPHLRRSITALSGSVRQWILSALDESDSRRVLRLKDGRRAMLGTRIAHGFFGDVRRVAIEGDDRVCVGKFLREQHRANAQARTRMNIEAEILRSLAIPGVPKLIAGDHGELPYLLLEEIDGVTLRDLLRVTPLLPVSVRDRLTRDLAETLARVHAAGVTHGDIKPENVMIGRGADHAEIRGWIVDFGLARRENDTRVTGEDATMGTRGFLDPQTIGAAKDRGPASDAYALGATLFELYAGRPLFSANDVRDPLAMTRTRHDALVTRALATLIDRNSLSLLASLLHFDGAKRPSIVQLSQQLPPGSRREWRTDEPDLRCALTLTKSLSALEKQKIPHKTSIVLTLSAGIAIAVGSLIWKADDEPVLSPSIPVHKTTEGQSADVEIDNNGLTVRLPDGKVLMIDRGNGHELQLAGKSPGLSAHRFLIDSHEYYLFSDEAIGQVFSSDSLSFTVDSRDRITIFSKTNDVAQEPIAKMILGKFLKSRRAFSGISSGDEAALLRANIRIYELQKAAGVSAASRKRP